MRKNMFQTTNHFFFFYMLGVDVQNLSKWVGPWILTQWQLFSTFQHLPCYRSFQYPKQGKPPPNFMSGINDLQETSEVRLISAVPFRIPFQERLTSTKPRTDPTSNITNSHLAPESQPCHPSTPCLPDHQFQHIAFLGCLPMQCACHQAIGIL